MSREVIYSREIGKYLDVEDVARMEMEDARLDRATAQAEADGRLKRCPTHGCLFVAGVGWCDLDGKNPASITFGVGGGCPECFWESRRVL